MPTITLYPSIDTYISSENPNTNYASDTLIKVGNDSVSSGYWRALFKVDLSSIPANAFITSAVFSLYNTGTGLPNNNPISVYALLRDWNEGTTTWLARFGGATPITWAFGGASGAGVDYIVAPYGSSTIDNTVGFSSWDITGLIQDWVWTYTTNYGMILSRYDTTFANNTKVFYSSNWGTPSQTPKLVITYTLSPDIPTLDSEPVYTKGTSNTIYWSDENPSGAIEYYPQMSTSNDFSTNITSLYNQSRSENLVPVSTTQVDTEYNIRSVSGVWLSGSKTGTNYFTTGTFVRNQITLGTALPSGTKSIYVEYVGDGWTQKLQYTFSNLIDGQTYFYRVRSRNALGAISKWSTYVYSTQDNILDDLELIYPRGLEVINGRTTAYIQWKATDITSGLADKTEILRSPDSGNTWHSISKNLSNITALTNENSTSVTTRRVYTKYQIQDVVGVWLSTDPGKTGTNYYLVGGATPLPSPFAGREIYLGTPLPSDTTSVIIDYNTFGLHQWNVPDNLDSNTSRIKIIVEDNVGNIKEIASDKDVAIFTMHNRLHKIYNTLDSSYISKIIKSFKSELSIQNDNTNELRRVFNISTAEGADLDNHGNSLKVARRSGEPDLEYRSRIISAIVSEKNTKRSVINAVAPFCLTEPTIFEWSNWDNIFFLDYSYLDYVDFLGAGSEYGGDPFTFEIWVQPRDNSFNTFLGIIDMVDKTKPAGTLAYIRLPVPGTLYGTEYYFTFNYSYLTEGTYF